MCGKVTQMTAWSHAVELSDLQAGLRSESIETVTPMRVASVIALDEAGVRRAIRMRWGLIPPGATDGAKPHIHARAETADTKRTFRDAFAARRGILAVTTFNEGREISPAKTEQYVLTPVDGAPIGIAVIWELWRNGDGTLLPTFAMLTVPPNEIVGRITDRMPALLDAADWSCWLGELPDTPQRRKALLKTSSRPLAIARAAKPPPRIRNDGQASLF